MQLIHLYLSTKKAEVSAAPYINGGKWKKTGNRSITNTRSTRFLDFSIKYMLQFFQSGLDHHETSTPPPHNSLPSFPPLHVQDAFLINGRRMDGLTEGPDNNG